MEKKVYQIDSRTLQECEHEIKRDFNFTDKSMTELQSWLAAEAKIYTVLLTDGDNMVFEGIAIFETTDGGRRLSKCVFLRDDDEKTLTEKFQIPSRRQRSDVQAGGGGGEGRGTQTRRRPTRKPLSDSMMIPPQQRRQQQQKTHPSIIHPSESLGMMEGLLNFWGISESEALDFPRLIEWIILCGSDQIVLHAIAFTGDPTRFIFHVREIRSDGSISNHIKQVRINSSLPSQELFAFQFCSAHYVALYQQKSNNRFSISIYQTIGQERKKIKHTPRQYRSSPSKQYILQEIQKLPPI